MTLLVTVRIDGQPWFQVPVELDPKERWRQYCRGKGISEKAIWICEWIERMSEKYGSIVRGHDKSWDWGQALCIECYGPNPDDWSDDPTDTDVARALAWEGGKWPSWAEALKGAHNAR